ncbi:hypothetical protein [Merismopedia glauca]|uniref:Uncharacterized protein n=1 Tax=Merismopedia glauca CCAP 1448/3 TaxID=1296344 RepID=A0A2T1C573_9CYAN|nr:hypothetical protein [Merismopedia glauca]PSB03401.1 hypothetical protein C7B64_08675 [Merismopedia glauca CCAP 1448/3]
MLKPTLAALILLLSTVSPATADLGKRIVRGDCGRRSCKAVLKDLRSRYPDYIREFEKQCDRPRILGLQVGVGNSNAQQVWFYCWDAKKEQGTRYGSYLGTLPLLGSDEAKFLSPLPSDSPYTAELKSRYLAAIKKAQFECATKSGNFIILTSESDNTVQLQCYFQGGVQPLDENGDFKSDGEASRGASVDEILGTFPVSESMEIK